jgi:hypothetical protein
MSIKFNIVERGKNSNLRFPAYMKDGLTESLSRLFMNTLKNSVATDADP